LSFRTRGGVGEDTIDFSKQPQPASRPAVLVVDNDAATMTVMRALQHVQDLKHAVDAAQAEMRTKDDALATVAHDLRNPLAVITMSVAALRQNLGSDVENSKLRDSVRHHLELADSTVDAMTRMVAELLDKSGNHGDGVASAGSVGNDVDRPVAEG
jgi:signal transduction histidine kinase